VSAAFGPERAPRVAPLPQERWGDDVHAALRAGFSNAGAERFISSGPDGIRVPNAVSTLLQHPRLAGPWLAYNGVLLFQGSLAPRLRELAILRVARRTGSDYEWRQHVRLAGGLGVTDEEIAAVGDGAAGVGWSPLDAAVLAATDELLDHQCIDDGTWTALAAHLDVPQLVELVFVVGTYTCLAMAFNSFGIQLDPDLDGITALPPPGSEA
jgi:alkylhydroperoxidase family enzyme